SHGTAGKLPELARRHQRHAPGERESDAEQEPARLDGDHGLGPLDPIGHGANRLSHGARLAQERRDVLEDDSGAGEVGNVSDVGAEVEIGAQWRTLPEARSSSW